MADLNLRARGFAALAAVVACLGSAVPLGAQADSVTVIAGPQYRAGALKRALVGEDYRDLWTTPVRVEVLDLDSFAGGLKVVKRGGGLQTKSLRLMGADGREYVFRSVDKEPALANIPDLKNTPAGETIRDQTSSINPAAALVAAPLLEAAGVLHAEPRLAVMPDDPALGEFRAEFAGMLGVIEERPDEGEDEQLLFAGSSKIAGTESVLEHLEEDPDHRVDSRAYLAARLMDVFLGDWDRHADQWRWARYDRGDRRVWVPIPRDRDYAFAHYDGVALDAARRSIPNAVAFDEGYGSLSGLVLNAQTLDRLLLADLARPVWDSVAAALGARLTDSVIEAAVRRMPPEYHALAGADLARTLKVRRDRLPEAAARFYARLSRAPEVHATDEPESAEIERMAGGRVAVRIYRRDKETGAVRGEPFFERIFLPGETDDIRVFLHGGDDHAVVRGAGGIKVRVLGGGGDDLLVDSAGLRGRGGETGFYDSRGDNRFVTGPRTRADRRPYEPPQPAADLALLPPRDWGSSSSLFVPWAGYRNEVGLILGGGPVYTRYGFRQDPYAYRLRLRGLYAFGSNEFAADFRGDFHRANSPLGFLVHARASQIDPFRFYGFGNETAAPGDAALPIVASDQLLAETALTWAPSPSARVSLGPVAKHTDLQAEPGSPLEQLGPAASDAFGQAGARAEAEIDRRDDPAYPRSGFLLRGGGAAYPAVWDVAEAFGETHAEGLAYVPLPGAMRPTLALRLGGKQVWGDFPVHEAAFLGGTGTLRGYRSWRYAGDATVYGTAELRAFLTRAKLLLVRGDLGALALADAGRVYADGESSDEWHTAAGGGLWFLFRFRDQPNTFSITYARGEKDRIYLRLGMPF